MTTSRIQKRLDFIINGIHEGQTLTEIGKYLGEQERGKALSGASISIFLKAHWRTGIAKKVCLESVLVEFMKYAEKNNEHFAGLFFKKFVKEGLKNEK